MQLLDWKITRYFFDRAEVIDAMGVAEHNSLMRAAGRIWKSAQRRIRRRKNPSKPGQSPTSHTDELRYGLRFAFDPSSGGAVVGPVKHNKVFFNNDRKPVKGTVPQILEEGGDITVAEQQYQHSDEWHRIDLRRGASQFARATRLRTVHIEARPFMAPAVEANLDKIPEAFRDSVRT